MWLFIRMQYIKSLCSSMYILFDIGGSKMRVAGSHDGKAFCNELALDTPAGYQEGLKLLLDCAEDIAKGSVIKGFVGGIAGPFDRERQILLASPNLPEWVGRDLVSDIEKGAKAPVHIENDAALVGLGEMHYGAGSTEGIAAYVTVSTGVGGARYVDGAIDVYKTSFEPGHHIIAMDQDIDIETMIGGRATEEREGKKPFQIKEEDFWDDYARKLAYGINNVIAFWGPEVIVLGGSMIVGDPAISVAQVRKYVRDITTFMPILPALREAKLDDKGGLYGAMALIKQKNI